MMIGVCLVGFFFVALPAITFWPEVDDYRRVRGVRESGDGVTFGREASGPRHGDPDMTQNTILHATQDIPAETALIAAQNDQFRRAIIDPPKSAVAGRLLVTPGVVDCGPDFMQEAIQLTADFDAFSPDADPYALHEMGVITVKGETVWWRIDLYDLQYEYGSEVPSDPEQTRRVLTILLPSEY